MVTTRPEAVCHQSRKPTFNVRHERQTGALPVNASTELMSALERASAYRNHKAAA